MTDAAHDAARGKLVRVGDIDLWVDVDGPEDGDAVVLLAGADTPGFRWTREIVDRLIGDGYRVVRFDHRDCGRSTRLGSSDAYLLDDLAADVVGLLDEIGISTAHLVGRSMGGMIAQVMALDHAHRVRSLSLFSTSPGVGDERLPGPDEAFVEKMTFRLFEGPPRGAEDQVAWIVRLAELMNGELYPLDVEAETELAAAEVATGWAAETGHGAAAFSSKSRLDRLAEIVAPTLVVHGSADVVLPIAHGRALAEGIPGAVYIEVDGLGHEVPDALVAEMWPVLKHHLSSSAEWTD
jgi:pimeloyl-ACP methyl ester carboxylesterase